ncbi:MAG: peptidoglycan DD-metalloendopeptidase family protein [Cryomorphaceae bacterium]|jgi:septal ring factor EnvC (AmiA/AmiB activator)|nr:peptidoglycan DD-metalloendopeptidase family protein [Cryomorphaceae bacterium]MDG1889327.1 peptidoglycan DD-metalloendopeptidase family protein [Flavobacteriaceae bacterium]MBT4517100.1 peptidoglycan DD-metalloendopeptidase family protein [Cryomorphaceae bacterium]MBT6935142.1 peptidoglycan DD-metalloendopeptidase family protein [Cryomorphaceae bacterium]MBT7018549.1 peptidoglycan DD-metalloendopeptidase family protein [Cryomorphaceae bacterium]|tara:strand:- start:1382 stop:2593 length:1212 start_codon:yes stop_codon:yes gene_type:complete
MKFLSKTFFFLLVFSVFPLNAQSYEARQKKLEAQKISLKKEINQINSLIADSRKKSKNLANDLEDLQLKISVRDKLINVNNSQLNNLTNIIYNQTEKLTDLESDLIKLKNEYEKIIYSSYKKRSTEMKLMFLFASENINQAFKRFQYFKQYSKYRKKQADKIVLIQSQISQTIDSLKIRKTNKQSIIDENRLVKQSLSQEKQEQNSLFKNLIKSQKTYAAEINKKEKQARLIDNEIKKLIRLAIAESNKNNNSTNFALTPEGRLISTNFQANKGRLPWPVKEGVIVRRFGTQPHPVVRTTTINSNGISVATSPNSVAYSVFDGEILSVYGFSGGNPGVLIRHGKYISNYQNLSSIFVKKGDKIKANDEIGIVFTNESTGKTVLKFNIFNELKPENPSIWLDKY